MCYALREEDFTGVAVVSPAHARALKGHETDAKDCARLAELSGCGLLQGSYIPAPELKELRDLTRYRTETVQARTSEIQRLGKALEPAGIKLGPVACGITGKGPAAMTGALTGGERRGAVLADLAIGPMRAAGKLAGLPMALEGRFTGHHALLCRLTRQAQARPHRRRRHLHQADAGPGRLGRDPGQGQAASPLQPAGAPHGRAEEPGREEKAIVAIAHTLLKIAYAVLKTGTPCQDPGAGFYTRRESPGHRQAWLERQLHKLHPGRTITITISPPPAPVPQTALTSGP